jgi:hypothetical protein
MNHSNFAVCGEHKPPFKKAAGIGALRLTEFEN